MRLSQQTTNSKDIKSCFKNGSILKRLNIYPTINTSNQENDKFQITSKRVRFVDDKLEMTREAKRNLPMNFLTFKIYLKPISTHIQAAIPK